MIGNSNTSEDNPNDNMPYSDDDKLQGIVVRSTFSPGGVGGGADGVISGSGLDFFFNFLF